MILTGGLQMRSALAILGRNATASEVEAPHKGEGQGWLANLYDRSRSSWEGYEGDRKEE